MTTELPYASEELFSDTKVIEIPYNWEPRNYQMNVWKHFQPQSEGQRGVCVWHRRAGKDLLGINLCATKAMQRVGTYWHVLPTYKQGRKIVWNGFTRDGRKFIDHFHPDTVVDKNQTDMRITFMNGSIYEVVGSDNIDSLVGTNPVGVIFSEYSLQDPRAWDYVRPILAENGGWALFIFTARGHNHGYKLAEMARKNDKWFYEKLVAGDNGTLRPDGTPVIPDTIIEDERAAGMPEELIQQEFYCSFDAPLVGAYYSHQMAAAGREGRIGKVPWEPQLPVHTSWDLGVDDSTSIWFFQVIGLEIRLIDYYEQSGEGLPHYAKVLSERPYAYGMHYAPFDISVKEFGSGKTRVETARSLGIKFRIVQKHTLEDGISAVRNVISRCWFDDVKADRGVQALKSYRKEFDADRKVFSSEPVHDWASHGADAFRILAWGLRSKIKAKPIQETAVDEHDYLNG